MLKDWLKTQTEESTFSYDDTNVKTDILDLFNNPNNFDFENIESFSREKLTFDLSNLLNNLI